ncbi:MAG: hypothetical protein PHE78_01780 [Candidatus Gastranaerophilales bacterium]|jgi:hypothetical protein|nr:hypothetical protein [Candidatus Gastranaerophilales bacterium]
MKRIFVQFVFKIIEIEKQFLKWYYDFRYGKYLNTKSVSSHTHITANETLHLDAQEKLAAKQTVEQAKSIFKENLKDPSKIFDYIKEHKTPVYLVPKANKALWFVGEEEGFITPKKGISALFLCLLINVFSKEKIPFTFKTPAMFVVRTYELSAYFLAYQLYHWMAYSRNLSGYDPKTVKNFKNIFNLENDALARRRLSIEEILSLREAIARDIEAIDMVKQLALEISGQKKASDKLKEQGDISI